MFLRLEQLTFDGGMGDAPKIRPVVVAVAGIDLVEHVVEFVNREARALVRITRDSGEPITCLATIDQVCEAIAQLTEGQGLVSIGPEASGEPGGEV